jgi:hypothetical protein
MSENNLIVNCNFTFQCPQKWDELEPTKDSDRRFCTSCERTVYFVNSTEDYEKASAQGNCIASRTILPNNLERIGLGMPSAPPPPPQGSNPQTVNEFLQALRIEDLKQAFRLQTQLELIDRSWAINKIAAALEMPERFEQALSLAQNGNIIPFDLNSLTLMLAERGATEQALAIIKYAKPSRDKALTLVKIATMTYETGDAKTSELIDQSFQLAQIGKDLITSKEFAEEFAQELEGMRLQNFMEYRRVIAEIVILAKKAKLHDKAVQIAQTIETDWLQIQALNKN